MPKKAEERRAVGGDRWREVLDAAIQGQLEESELITAFIERESDPFKLRQLVVLQGRKAQAIQALNELRRYDGRKFDAATREREGE